MQYEAAHALSCVSDPNNVQNRDLKQNCNEKENIALIRYNAKVSHIRSSKSSSLPRYARSLVH